MNFIVITIILVAVISTLFLFNKKPKKEAHVLLMAFYLIILIIFINFYSGIHQIKWLYLLTNLVASGTCYLLGASIYLFVMSLFGKLNRKKIAYSLLPFSLQLLLINIPFSLSNPVDGYYFEYLSFVQHYSDELYLIELLCFFLFNYSAYTKVEKVAPLMSTHYSHISKNQINWVKHLLWGVFVFIVIDLGQTLYLIITDDLNFPEVEITLISSAFIIAFITYHGLYLSKILIHENIIETLHEKEKKKSQPYEKSTFSEAETDLLKQNLTQLLSVKKIYLNEALTLSDVADKMSISEKKLSYFINHILHTNFYELINEYRLEDFKRKVVDPKNKIYSIVAIANQCGFKSKTSFYAFFKKKEGKTPSKFLEQARHPKK